MKKKAAKVKQIRSKSENRSPRTVYATSKDKTKLYRFVNSAQRAEYLLSDNLVPIDALTFRVMSNADVGGKLTLHDMRGIKPTPNLVPIQHTSEEVQRLLETFKSGVSAILNEVSQKLDRFQPGTNVGSSIERTSTSH